MNILITGGAGFIGTNLSRKLLELGHNVYILDDLSTGRMKNIDFLRSVKSEGELKFFKCDITELAMLLAIKQAYLPTKIDQIYHLACPASPPKYYQDPLKTLATNYVGTKNVLELAKAYKARILFSSTSEVYGDPKEHPQMESYTGNVDPTSPRSVYDEGKRVAETLVCEYHRQFKVDTRIARIFNTYGPHMDPDDGRVITNFIKQFLREEPFTVYGTGEQTRSFCYIDDMVDGLILLMNSDKFVNEPVNIGNPEELPMIAVACHIAQSWEIPIDKKPLPISDPARRNPHIAKMRSLGWEPKIKFRDGVYRTIQYMKKEIENDNK